MRKSTRAADPDDSVGRLTGWRRGCVDTHRTAVRWVRLAFAALVGCVAASAAAEALSDRVDALIAPLVAAHEFSGAVVLMRQGKPVYSRGFGAANVEAGVPFTADTPSDGGSLAKNFTAAAVWWLAHEGTIDVDAPVRRYLPEFPHPQTTVRHLLAHSNGLPPYYEFFDRHFGPAEVRTTPAMLRVVARELPAPSFAPGTRFEYSNFGYDVAALVVERASGQPFGQFLQQRFFDRLGMRSSFARPGRLAEWKGVRTTGQRWRNGRWEAFDVFDLEAFIGASNLYFSANDLARWAAAHADGTALPPEVVAAGQRRPLIAGAPSPITGLSWYCDTDAARCYYTGTLNAFHSFVYWDRARGEAVVFVSNGATPPWKVITLQRDLVDALAGRAGTKVAPVRFERIGTDARPTLAGRYAIDAGGDGALVLVGGTGRLRIRAADGLEFDVFQVSREVFYVPGLDYWLAFEGGTPPAAMHVRSMFVDAVARRAPQPAPAR
jgi:CubicO group peptidase (beta-lactamase class C family)